MSAVPLHVSPASSSGDVVSVQNLLDSLCPDTILLSSDSCEVRVPKLYITKFSPVLGALIQDASNSTIPTNAEAPLPAVQLPESGTTLINLLSFIFPLSPALPPTSDIEATMELLSAAQKYKMSSVLAHIRLCLAQRDPPFIHEDNAFRAYSLAQKYGLRQEAVNAAQLTMKLSFAFQLGGLEGELDVMPGAYLHELWKFHERFRTCGFKCISRSPSGIPSWLDYIISIAAYPILYDFVQFQKAWVQHVKGSTGCPHCGGILPEVVRTIWTAINTVIHGSVEKAESALTILGGETHSRDHISSPTTPLSMPEYVDSILATSSSVFNDMLSFPQPSNNEGVDGLPIVQLSEDAELVRSLITTLYPIPSEMPDDRILALLTAAQNYDMGTVQSSIRAEVTCRKLSTLNGAQVFRTYAIASSKRLIPEMNMAARLSLDHPMTFEYIGAEMRLFEGWALRALVKFRVLYMDNLISCFESFLDPSTGPSEIWVACPGPGPKPHHSIRISILIESSSQNSPRFNEAVRDSENSLRTSDSLGPRIDADKPGGGGAGAPCLPARLHNVIRKEIGGSSRSLECPLVGPSGIRTKYISALQGHVTTDKCTFCSKVHALKGENYIVELERALTQIQSKTYTRAPTISAAYRNVY
ncbi:hypothetical protein BJY52DRAFT_1191699 [Lactarius psammicola]|nr:hypothetical protein BJY52DRAFT_1191699 [Lactarius psammicola]